MKQTNPGGQPAPHNSTAVNLAGWGGFYLPDRVGADGDLLLTQNVNTALQQERANVVLLMTYRADTTEITNTNRATDPVSLQSVATSTNIGQYGIGGAYGVYYNTALSLFPFQ